MNTVKWNIHLKSRPEKVFGWLNTQAGREKFWAEVAPEKDGVIHFTFPNGTKYASRILEVKADQLLRLDYFNSEVTFTLVRSKDQGTDLRLINEGISDADFLVVHAGWVSVLMNLKAAVDHDVDLRNHDNSKTWDQNYVDN